MLKVNKSIILTLVLALVCTMIVGCISLHLSPTSASASDGVRVSISSVKEVALNTSFVADVEISYVENFDACNYVVSFDSNMLRLDEITNGNINNFTIPVDIWNMNKPGLVSIVQNIPGIEGVTGSGDLAVLHFHVIGSTGGIKDISLSEGVLSSSLAEEIPAMWNGCSVNVISEVSGSQVSTLQSTPPPGPSSTAPSSMEPEPEVASGTVAEVPTPAPLLPPAPGSGKKSEAAPESRAKVAEPDSTPAKLLPPAPEPGPISQPWLWIVVGGVIVIIVLFIIVRLSRRPF